MADTETATKLAMDTEDVVAAVDNDVDASADPATDDNGEAEVAHGEAELTEAEDAEEEEELDPIAARAPRRRGGCGRLLRCCFILVCFFVFSVLL